MLTILPGPPESNVRCEMEVMNLFEPQIYTALSYCWGDPNVTTAVIINNVETQVTVNLANALHQLRALNIARTWADALCINQLDQAEKSDQIRYMKYIYERAEETYIWLGSSWHLTQTAPSTISPISFLRAISIGEQNALHSHTIPEDTPATSGFELQSRQRSQEQDNCQPCLLQTRIFLLLDPFSMEYWRRCWIIQEVTVASRISLLHGDERISWNDMTAAVERCRDSCCWSPDLEVAYQYVQKLVHFRLAYRRARKPSLVTTILSSYESLATEPRDKIFALLGVSLDGQELVPTPNYLQPVDSILKDLTRALIRMNGRLDVILLNKHKQVSPILREGLPSWSPDWLAEDLDTATAILAHETSIDPTERSIVLENLSTYGNILQVEGVVIGTIVNTTTQLTPGAMCHIGSSGDRDLVHTIKERPLSHQDKILAGLALFSCLALTPETISGPSIRGPGESMAEMKTFLSPWQYEFYQRASWASHFELPFLVQLLLLRVCSYRYVQQDIEPAEQEEEEASSPDCGSIELSLRVFNQWLLVNSSFLFYGITLDEWLTESKFQFFVSQVLQRPTIVWILISCLILAFSGSLLYLFIRGLYYTDLTALSISISFWLLLVFVFIQFIFVLSDCKTVLRHAAAEMGHAIDYLGSSGKVSKNLFIADKDFLGASFSGAEIGDKICFLVGCQSAVLLRQHVVGHHVQYRVVGDAFVCLSKDDQELYAGFLACKKFPEGEVRFGKYEERVARPVGIQPRRYWRVSSEDPEQPTMEDYRRKGILRKFELI